MAFPTKKEIEEVLKNLGDDDFSIILPKDANKVDKVKYFICQKFVVYLLENEIPQSELARKLNVDRSRINWIIKYRIDHFTIDYLYDLLVRLKPETELKLN